MYQENLLSKKIYLNITEIGLIGMFHLTLSECNFAVLDEKKTASKCGLWAQSKDRENDSSISVEHIEVVVLVVTRQSLLLNCLLTAFHKLYQIVYWGLY